MLGLKDAQHAFQMHTGVFRRLTLESQLFSEADMGHEVLLLLLGSGWELIRLELFEGFAQQLGTDRLQFSCLFVLVDALFILLCNGRRSSGLWTRSRNPDNGMTYSASCGTHGRSCVCSQSKPRKQEDRRGLSRLRW